MKRNYWLMFCAAWGVFWLFTLLFLFLPALFLAPASFLMMLCPVGVSDAPAPPKHDPNKWSEHGG